MFVKVGYIFLSDYPEVTNIISLNLLYVPWSFQFHKPVIHRAF